MGKTTKKAKNTKPQILDGTEIRDARTLKSWHDNNCIEVVDGEGQYYLISTKSILTLLNEFTFNKVKKRKYIHLEPRAKFSDEQGCYMRLEDGKVDE